MNLRCLHAFANLAVDAVDAVAHLFAPGINRAADDLWDWTKADAAERAAADRLAEKEAEEAVSEPLRRFARAASKFDDGLIWSFTGHPQFSVAAPRTTGHAATEPPGASVASPRDAGHPNLSRQQLDDAAHAVRSYAGRLTVWAVQDAWLELAEDLESAAKATK